MHHRKRRIIPIKWTTICPYSILSIKLLQYGCRCRERPARLCGSAQECVDFTTMDSKVALFLNAWFQSDQTLLSRGEITQKKVYNSQISPTQRNMKTCLVLFSLPLVGRLVGLLYTPNLALHRFWRVAASNLGCVIFHSFSGISL